MTCRMQFEAAARGSKHGGRFHHVLASPPFSIAVANRWCNLSGAAVRIAAKISRFSSELLCAIARPLPVLVIVITSPIRGHSNSFPAGHVIMMVSRLISEFDRSGTPRCARLTENPAVNPFAAQPIRSPFWRHRARRHSMFHGVRLPNAVSQGLRSKESPYPLRT